MSTQEEEEVPSLTFTSLETASTVDILSAPLRDLRKVLQDGPPTHRNQAELPSRKEVLTAVLELQKVLHEEEHESAEDKANSEKLFALPPSEVIRLSRCARPLLIRMMKSALRFDPTLQPRTFEPSDQGSVACLVLSWHVVATQRALQTAVSSNPAPQNNAPDQTLLLDSSNADQEHTVEQEQFPQATPIVETNENREGMLPSDNPFATNNSKARELSPVDFSELIPRNSPPKRRLLTLKEINSSKRVKFSNICLISAALQRSSESPSSPGFRTGASPAEQVPPYLMGEYVGRKTTQLVLRIFDFKGAEILTGLLQEETSIEQAVKNRHWKRPPSGEPYQSEQEARTLAKIIHLTLMVFETVEDALSMASWLEVCLRRLCAICYIEDHSQSASRATLWKLANKMLETQAASSLQVPSMEKMMAQHATLISKAQSAISSLTKRESWDNAQKQIKKGPHTDYPKRTNKSANLRTCTCGVHPTTSSRLYTPSSACS